MADLAISRQAMMRATYLGLALLVIFFHLLPLNTMPRAWGKVSRPALTKPMAAIVVALDDCSSVVVAAPVKEPVKGLRVKCARTRFRKSPAMPFRPSVITTMPSRKSPIPPSTCKMPWFIFQF